MLPPRSRRFSVGVTTDYLWNGTLSLFHALLLSVLFLVSNACYLCCFSDNDAGENATLPFVTLALSSRRWVIIASRTSLRCCLDFQAAVAAKEAASAPADETDVMVSF